MKSFRFKARNKAGTLKEGVVRADSPQHAAQHFKDMGMLLISLKEQRESKSIISKINFGTGVKAADIMIFARQMYALCIAGLPIVNGLKSLETGTKNRGMSKVIEEVRHDVEAGASFSAALAKHPKVFDSIFCSTVKAGEASGSLPEVMRRLAMSLEKDDETKGRMKQALTYPVIIGVIIVVAIFTVGIFVLPRFTVLFDSFPNAELPVFTKILIAASAFMRSYWYLCVGGFVGIIFGFKFTISTPIGKNIFDRIVLKAMVFGPLYVKISMSRFSHTIATLIKSGVPIVETLDLSGKTTDNTVLTKSMENIKDKVKEGKSIASSMSEEPIFPDMVVQMVGAGEEAGRVDELMDMVGEFYEREADIVIKNLTTLLEPIMLVFIAGIVLVLALGIFLPLWNLQAAMKG